MSETVREQIIFIRWGQLLHEQILALPAECHVGRQVVEYLSAVDQVLDLTGESDLKVKIIQAARRQCEVWLFG